MEKRCYFCTLFPHKYNITYGVEKRNLVEWESCKDHAWQDNLVMRYETFRKANIGYIYKERYTERTHRKLVLWYKYIDSEFDLLLLMANTHPLYELIPHPDWEMVEGKMKLKPEFLDTKKIYYEKTKYGQEKESAKVNEVQ